MKAFQNVLVQELLPPFTVFSAKGRTAQMTERFAYAVSFCISGQITYTHRGQSFVSRPGAAVLLPRGASYTLHGDQEGQFPLINFQCDGLSCESFLVIPLHEPGEYLKAYQRIADAFLHEQRLKAFSEFYELLHRLDGECAPKSPILKPLDDYIRGALSDPGLSNQRLAARLGISEVYLRKLFLKHYGTGPKQYILELRLQNAKRLLANTACSVTEIAEACGFGSVYHFCRIFKEKEGCTPSDYAKRNRIYVTGDPRAFS